MSVYLFLVGKIKKVSYAQQGCIYLIKYIINNKHYCKKKNSLKHDFYILIHYNEKIFFFKCDGKAVISAAITGQMFYLIFFWKQ